MKKLILAMLFPAVFCLALAAIPAGAADADGAQTPAQTEQAPPDDGPEPENPDAPQGE